MTEREDGLAKTILQAQAEQDVLARAIDLADYVRPRYFKHVTEVKLIEAVDKLRRLNGEEQPKP